MHVSPTAKASSKAMKGPEGTLQANMQPGGPAEFSKDARSPLQGGNRKETVSLGVICFFVSHADYGLQSADKKLDCLSIWLKLNTNPDDFFCSLHMWESCEIAKHQVVKPSLRVLIPTPYKGCPPRKLRISWKSRISYLPEIWDFP